jgi:NAD-dependent dihydropyrimidine dehydrogenase PreA subunit
VAAQSSVSQYTAHEYICEDCGALYVHDNPTTLESMKDVHNQLCAVKRQKTIAAESAKAASRLAAAKSAAAASAMAPAASSSSPPSPASSSPAASPAPGGNTTISLTGTGTSYSKAEGPIDAKFKEKRQQAGMYEGHKIWGPIDPPGQLGIWGSEVCVDFDICIADGACIEACPVNVYEWLETPGHPGSDKKPFMAREKDCIFCLACENVCPPQAIKIFQRK